MVPMSCCCGGGGGGDNVFLESPEARIFSNEVAFALSISELIDLMLGDRRRAIFGISAAPPPPPSPPSSLSDKWTSRVNVVERGDLGSTDCDRDDGPFLISPSCSGCFTRRAMDDGTWRTRANEARRPVLLSVASVVLSIVNGPARQPATTWARTMG